MENRPTRLGRIIVAGGSGFLGRSLCEQLRRICDDVVVLTRGHPSSEGGVRNVNWDARTVGPWAAELEGAAGIVNFVGRTVDCRKTELNKRVILQSRLDSVRALAGAFAGCVTPPRVWVQAATAHIVGDTQDEVLDETAPIGSGFAPEVGRAWEAAVNTADLRDCRRVILRISFVLGRNGGALKTLARLARLGLGGTVGHGRQWMSWLHIEDLDAMILRALSDQSMSGAYLATAPNPVTNRQFMRELRGAVHRPWSPPTPALAVRLGTLLMRTDPELALLGRRCVPARLMREGFVFAHPQLRETLRGLLE